jgi:hypothetical protein
LHHAVDREVLEHGIFVSQAGKVGGSGRIGFDGLEDVLAPALRGAVDLGLLALVDEVRNEVAPNVERGLWTAPPGAREGEERRGGESRKRKEERERGEGRGKTGQPRKRAPFTPFPTNWSGRPLVLAPNLVRRHRTVALVLRVAARNTNRCTKICVQKVLPSTVN